MKSVSTLFITTLAIFSLSACAGQPETDINEGWDSFGAQISAIDYVSLDEVIDQFSEESETQAKIAGTLENVCQNKGCWTTLKTEDGRSLRMTFENYSFFIPVDAAGRDIIAEGVGFKKVTSVSELKHYAEDAKASPEEIAAITEPRVEYSFEASGVLIR